MRSVVMSSDRTMLSDLRPVRDRALGNKIKKFSREEAGSMTLFTLFCMIVMLIVAGMAVDLMRFESTRIYTQNTLDNAVLAAADREQTLDPEDVVNDYFQKAGLGGIDITTHIDEDTGHRVVAAMSDAEIDPLFMQFMGFGNLNVPAIGEAREGVSLVEISLVLDVSGSMGNNDRLPNLKVAAKSFIDEVITENGTSSTGEKLTHISIVPFATQVNAGADLAPALVWSGEHTNSFCVDWTPADYDTIGLPDNSVTVRQTGHFDVLTGNLGSSSWFRPVCRTQNSRQILPVSGDAQELKDHIDSFFASGYTSIEVGTKWGAALLDPSSRSIVTSLINSGDVHSDFDGRPYDHSDGNALKVMIVMSDGANTYRWWLNDNFQSGMSNFYKDNSNRISVYSPSDSPFGMSRPYYHKSDDWWHSSPDGGSAQQLTWPQAWSHASVHWWRKNVIRRMLNSNSASHAWANTVFTRQPASEKDQHTSSICAAARAQGIVIYTIGFETDDDGDATLKDCASSDAHFFHAEGMEIADVFDQIAGNINQLKLTH